ncbi:hypothetical protein RRG08_060408 [Elysia crispata]|uniref:Uncharacterized protein n=1 Tax=Elysia crispata TaxID=231223 RepID=A0AAE1E184_9GAST|nr:hypothetical protein RRG08_060408 [Elysia crispata]
MILFFRLSIIGAILALSTSGWLNRAHDVFVRYVNKQGYSDKYLDPKWGIVTLGHTYGKNRALVYRSLRFAESRCSSRKGRYITRSGRLNKRCKASKNAPVFKRCTGLTVMLQHRSFVDAGTFACENG